MSIKYLVYAFDARVNNPLRKLVLLKLCDNANDSGECWPSFQHIADQCEISRRSAINHIQALIDCGILVSEARFKSGEQTTNMYKISKEKLIFGGAGAALGGANAAPPPVQELHPPSAGAAPRTVIEPSIGTVIESDLKPTAEKPEKIKLNYSSWPQIPDKQILDDWLSLRKQKRAPVSQTVLDTFGGEFRKAATFGYSVNDCLRAAIASGWTGFKFEWMQNQNSRGQQNGNNGQPKSPIERFMQQHYPDGGAGFQNDQRPVGGNDGAIRGVVDSELRGVTGQVGAMATDLIGDFSRTDS